MEVVITQNKEELERLEGIIDRNVGGFYQTGMALMEIREAKYYHNVMGYETFEEYCKKRWDMGRIYAWRLIEATEARNNLLPIGNISATEGQLRPLTKFKDDPGKQIEAWQQAVATAPDGKVTAAHVYKIVKGMIEESGEPGGDPKPTPEDSPHVAKLKAIWNASKKKDKIRFMRWITECFPEMRRG